MLTSLPSKLRTSRSAPCFTGARGERGVALMMVIFVFALVSILAVGMYSRQGLFLQKSANIAAQTQAYEYALAAEIYGRRLLKADWDEDSKASKFVDNLEQVQSSLFLPVDEAILEAQFNDLQGRLNLNDVIDLNGSPNTVVIERIKRLINRLGLESFKLELLQDWIDDNQEPSNFEGAEDGDYLGLDIPYRTAAQPFAHLSELKLLFGLSDEDFDKLSEHVCVLPRGHSPVNVNTASAEVLQALVKGLNDQQAKAMVSSRGEQGWDDIDQFKADSNLSGLNVDAYYMGVASSYFELATKITLADRVVRLKSLLYRDASNGELQVLQRDQGQKYIITKDKAKPPA